jgi:predicted nucleic acid-binding protein
MRYFLDTTFAIDYLRGLPAAERRFARMFEEGDEPYVNEVVLCELAVGIAAVPDRPFVGFTRAISFVQPAAEMAIQAGAWRRDAKRQGRTLDLADALIAAAAQALGAPVLTRNRRDFALTPVAIEEY